MASTQIVLEIKAVFSLSLWQSIKFRMAGLYKNPDVKELLELLAGEGARRQETDEDDMNSPIVV